MSGAYDFWRARLKGDKSPATMDEPQCGFWRLRKHKGGPFIPLAIFPGENGFVECAFGIEPNIVALSEDELNAKWQWANAHPVLEAVWRSVAEHGKPWPDADVVAEAQQKQAQERHIGDNSGNYDVASDLADRISTARVGISDFESIKDRDHADRSQSRRALLLALAGEADDHRLALKRPHLDELKVFNEKISTLEALKRPHLDANDKIDGEWMPIVKGAKADADLIKRAQDAYVTEQLREAERIAAEQAASAVSDHVPEEDVIDEVTGKVMSPEPAPPPPPVAPPANFRGSSGRAASVGTKTVVKEVTNWLTLYMQYGSDPTVRAALLALANRDVEAGKTVDGVKTEIVGRIK